MKICKSCKEEKDDSEFKKTNYYKGKFYLSGDCISCLNVKTNISQKAWRAANPEKYKSQGERASHNRRIKASNRSEEELIFIREKRWSRYRSEKHKNMYQGAKKRALKKGIEFTIIPDDIIIPEICPILGIPLFIGDKTCYFNSPTLDRKDTSKGYTKENIGVISMLANSMKNAATKEQLLLFTQNIIKYLNNDIV